MQPPAIPEHEPARLQALLDLSILDTPSEERFDRLTRLAQQVFGVSIALVSLVDAERQWFKSRQGVDACETGRDISFCGHAILDDGIFQVTDARLDPRFADNPLVTGGPHIRFYAGAPLRSEQGHRIGTLCIIDDKPRKLSAQEESALRDLADCVEDEINRTEQRHTEIALREQAQNTQAMLDTMVDGLLTIDRHGTIQTANHSAEHIFGYSAEEMIGRNVKMLMPQPFRGEHDGYLHNYLTSGQAKIIGIGRTVTGLRKNGSTFPMDLSVGEMKGENGARMFTGIVRDVTERVVAEHALEEQRQFALDMIETLTIPTFIVDAEHRVLVWNRACVELTGVPAAEVIGTKDAWRGFYPTQRPCLADFVLEQHDKDVAAHYAHIDTSHFSERGLHAEGWFPNLNGKRRYLMFDAAPIFNSQGTIVAAIESLEDITERKVAEEELKQFKNTLDQTLDCVFMFDANSLLFFCVNEGAMRQVGYTHDELLTLHPYDIKPEFSEPQFRELIAPLLAGEQASLSFETVHQHKNGQRVPVEVFLQYIADEPAHFVAIVRDITERQKIDRMKSEFISTVSHELRTPLTSIVGSLGLVMGGMAGELTPQGKTLIDLAHKNSQRLVELINDILDMEKIEAGSMAFNMKPMALMPLLAQSLEATKGYFEHHGNRCILAAPVDVMDKVRVAFSRIVHRAEQAEFNVTMSCGIAVYRPGETHAGLSKVADDALYQAKHGGRNKVVLAQEEGT